MKVKTVKAGREYRIYVSGASYGVHLSTEGDVVWLMSKTANHGGWRIERFGGVLSPASIRAFFTEAAAS